MAGAATISRPTFGTAVDERTCAVRNPAVVFKPAERQIFVSFVANNGAASDRLKIEWLDPSGAVADTADYPHLPDAARVCFVAQLPVAGFAASSRPGRWSVRVLLNGNEALRAAFDIAGDGTTASLRISSVTRQAGLLVLDGAGFDSRSVIHIAEYKKTGGWRYIHSVLPREASANRISAEVPSLPAGEYLAIVRNADDETSRPLNFTVATAGGYRLPLLPSERWLITQGPYGSFSHWGNSIQAYDIAPVSGEWIAAMRGGVAHTHDVGAVQSHTLRTFGNYITIDHGDGEWSHYAHLLSGSFKVREGQRVEAGQVLAHVGNSGYTFGGYHVHVHITKAEPVWAQSVPFRFSEFASLEPSALRYREVSGSGEPILAAAAAAPAVRSLRPGARRTSGSVAVGGVWSETLTIVAGTKTLEVELSWSGEGHDLDLRLVSPDGRYYGGLGEKSGYSGPKSNPERLKITAPTPGLWRLMAAGMAGGGEAIPFTLETFAASR